MTLQELFARIDGDYEDVTARFRGEERVQKFVLRFPADPSYRELCDALAAGNYQDAFRAAHTLKGVCQNLGFSGLYKPSSELTELLRGGQEQDCAGLLQAVSEQYDRTIAALEEFQAGLQ